MGKYYLYALFIFFLLVILLWVYFKLSSLIGAEDRGQSEKDRQLYMLYQNLDELLISIENYIEDSKLNISEEREKIELLLEEARALRDGKLEELEPKEPEVHEEETIDKLEGIHEKVMKLKKDGLSIEEIAKKLQISKGEVSLIQEIAKR